MPERPAPLVLVVAPEEEPPFGSYAAVAAAGRRLLAAELTQRLGRLGAAVAPLRPERADAFHWGRWFTGAARDALEASDTMVDAVGYAGAGALALLGDAPLDELLGPVPGEVVANNRFSADAFVVAGDLDVALAALEVCPSDNACVRVLEEAGFRSRDLSAAAYGRFDVDTPLDLALLRLAGRLTSSRRVDAGLSRFLEMAQLPGGRGLVVPHLDELGTVIRDRHAELVVAGRVPAATLRHLETETACRVRAFVEERGMRSAREGRPRSLLAAVMDRSSPAALVEQLAGLGDAVVLDSRVLMAALAGSAEERDWPPAEERYASDFLDSDRIATPWLREIVEAAGASPVPFLLGGHGLVSDGLRILVEAAWLGR